MPSTSKRTFSSGLRTNFLKYFPLYLIALRKHGKRRFRKNLLFINGKCQSIEPLRSQAKRKVQILT
nr:MAG TPA: hypothetical protein [Caudoviricetes sp.]DAV12237.1 MAG TPA: hypothetical protein [Caudoviricetes sp.]